MSKVTRAVVSLLAAFTLLLGMTAIGSPAMADARASHLTQGSTCTLYNGICERLWYSVWWSRDTTTHRVSIDAVQTELQYNGVHQDAIAASGWARSGSNYYRQWAWNGVNYSPLFYWPQNLQPGSSSNPQEVYITSTDGQMRTGYADLFFWA